MKASLALLILACVCLLPGVQAGPEVTVLLHHPDDGVDPFGFPYGPGGDYFTTTYGSLVADKQRFDFPFFVADGVLPLEQIPDPKIPFESSRAAYEAAAQQRLQEASPVTMTLATETAGSSVVVAVELLPVSSLAGEDFHLVVAIAEDPVMYLPPAGLTNGVEDHRFTVRLVRDLGPVDLTAAWNGTHSLPLDDAWQRDRLLVAVWLQQNSPSPRFDAREVAQVTHVRLGEAVVQANKGVLLEMLSATWCEPCLYGDLALEAVAVAHGVAEPLEPDEGPRYFRGPNHPLLTIFFSSLAGVAVAGWGKWGVKP